MEKATEQGKEWFGELLPPDGDVLRRPMFGNLAGFVNGNMFLCLFGDDIAVRLGEDDRAELVDEGGAAFEPMADRPMKEYVTLPRSYLEDLAGAKAWVARSLEHTRAMPAKVKKPTGKK